MRRMANPLRLYNTLFAKNRNSELRHADMSLNANAQPSLPNDRLHSGICAKWRTNGRKHTCNGANHATSNQPCVGSFENDVEQFNEQQAERKRITSSMKKLMLLLCA